MSATADSAAGQHGLAEKLGIGPGTVIQEIGYDDDCDDELRRLVVERTGQELVDEDYDDVVDVVMIWWREGDGDLVDALVDALAPLADHGVIWLLTPKAARPGHVEPSDVSEAAPTAGLQQTSSISAGRDLERGAARRAAGRSGEGPMTVQVGDEAPDFELRDQHAQTHRLSSYRGSKNVVLVFYPFAFTGVCTGEMVEIRDELASLQNDETQVLAISCDTVASLRVFAERENLDYPLLSDFWPHGAVSTAYGVFNDALGAADRGTFVIDRNGVVRWTVRNALSDARNLADYQKVLAEL